MMITTLIYMNILNNELSSNRAKDYCENVGGYLATITSIAEDVFVYTNLGENSPNVHPWLGGYQTVKTGEPFGNWAWVTGEEWNYDNWAGAPCGEPNNCKGIEDYLVYLTPWDECSDPSRESFWNDLGEGGEVAGGGCGCGGCTDEWYHMSTICEYDNHDLYLYDDFNSKLIDPDKWSGGDLHNIGLIAEIVREIPKKKKQLRLGLRGYGDPGDWINQISNGVRFRYPDDIKAIKATVKVQDFESPECPDTDVRVEILGAFFCTKGPCVENMVNEVHATIFLERRYDSVNPENVFDVKIRVSHSGLDYIRQSIGTVEKGQDVTLMMQWDPDNDRFVFQKDDEEEVEISYEGKGWNENEPFGKFKGLRVHSAISSCSEPPAMGFVEADIDDVFVNSN